MLRPTNRLLRRQGPHQVSPAYAPGESPLPLPDGWFCVGLSSELRPGDVVSRRLGNEDLVLYRTASGLLRATRPYCPHMGVHLGQGGTVQGEDIMCPFHKFRYGTDGVCSATGPAYHRVPRLKLSTIPVRESHGFMLAWLHHAGAEPSWEIPALDTTGFSPPVQHLVELPGHPQEVAENVFDFGHLTGLHGEVFDGATGDAVFDEGPSAASRGCFSMRPPLPWGMSSMAVPYEIQLHGLGHIVTTMHMPVGLVLRAIILATPVGPWRIQLRSCLSAKLDMSTVLPSPLGALGSSLLSSLVGRMALAMHKRRLLLPEITGDGPAWASKKYYPRPRVIDGDGPILPYRKWAERFYPAEALRSHPAPPNPPSPTDA